ncbi:MAG: A/G-specific adenine glycosylase [Pseudomonadota bacterium]
MSPQDAASLQSDLLQWYDRNRRDLPWRAPPGHKADPYHVWLSEIMLQQTTTTAAAPYYRRFLEAFPRVEDLAAAEQEEVLTLWAGLGYYARARNLHACAQRLVADFDGRFPQEEAALMTLPGIGSYTAAAIAAIAFDKPAAPLDGNWERVVARLFDEETPLPKAKPRLKALAEQLVPRQRAGDFAQAMMDLGATVCTPEKPRCLLCPLAAHCTGLAAGTAESLPRKLPKAAKPDRHGVCFWVVDARGQVLLRRRPQKGLLGGMIEVPGTPWRNQPWSEAEALSHVPGQTAWESLPGQVTHVFTHFRLTLQVWRAPQGAAYAGWGGEEADRWVGLDALGDEALPSLMRKVVRLATKNR